ncbi:YheC/YheD family protein [Bacillus shivajii]|uniref:YheC/YheD family endospore coat-associated protein n=1 Tax=Bacillus shivajii TaxID=1983719 RepID=UPI001CFBD4F8|nr:YheC/YheD family protein [Bacillus shivajii]UCZ54297.1 YheC/YheD family protein [Bacillus shivajii]
MFSYPFYIRLIDCSNTLNEYEIMIPQKAASIWNLRLKQKMNVSYHFHSSECTISISDKMVDHTILLSEQLAEKLQLPLEQPIQCFYDQEAKVFHFGPSIGMVIGEGFPTNEQIFGTITSYATAMAKKAYDLYLPFFVFPFQDIHEQKVNGYRFDGEQWIQCKLLLPHVIYNRIGRRDQENTQKATNFFKKLNEHNIPYFNERFINKWEAYTLFLKEPTLAPFLPETTKIKSKDDFFSLFDKYDNFYLKPSWGKEGNGIMSMSKEESTYCLQFPLSQDKQTKFFETDKQVYEYLKYKLSKRQYIAQPRIKSIKYNNAFVDFRVLCMKDHVGEWKCCSAIARIGSEKNIVTNLSQGGTQLKVLDVLQDNFKKDHAQHMERFLHELAIHAASSFDIVTLGHYGELGFDFMVDQQGHIYILEVNIKPTKGELLQVDDSPLPSIRYILNYASSLSSFV